MDCVLHMLRGETFRPGITFSDWHAAFQVAEQENVLPYFAAKLRQSGANLPDLIAQDLARIEQTTARSNFWWTSELRGILQAFALEALPVIPLKGPMLAQRIYGSTDLRISRDLDLLVRPGDINLACSLLEKLGFVSNSRPSDYHHSWHRGTTLVELHFDVENPLTFNFDTPAAWQRAKPQSFLGQPVLQFAPSDELLFICLHGVRHCFEQLSHILDIALALNRLSPEIDPTEYEIGPIAKLRPLIVLGCAMATRLAPLCNPELKIQVPAKTSAYMEKLADSLWTSLLQNPSPPQNWRIQHRFYLQTEATTLGRLRRLATDLCILATRLTQLDFDFAASYGMHQPALVWILRQLRLLARLCGLGPVTD